MQPEPLLEDVQPKSSLGKEPLHEDVQPTSSLGKEPLHKDVQPDPLGEEHPAELQREEVVLPSPETIMAVSL